MSHCGSWALEPGVNSCGTQVYLLLDTWDLPGLGIEPVSPALAGGFFTREAAHIESCTTDDVIMIVQVTCIKYVASGK